MLYVCVRGVMDVVFYICIVMHGDVGACVWEVHHACVVCLYLVCILWQFSMLHYVNGRGCKRRQYGKGT